MSDAVERSEARENQPGSPGKGPPWSDRTFSMPGGLTIRLPRLRLTWLLVILVLAVLIPALGFGSVAAWRAAQGHRAAAEGRLRDTAMALALAVDREISAFRSATATLAGSAALDGPAPDLDHFEIEARRAATALDTDFVLLDAMSMRHLIHTGLPSGYAADGIAAADFRRVVEAGRPLVTDLVMDVVVQRPMVGVAWPVRRDGDVPFVLVTLLTPERLQRLLAAQNLDEGGFAAIIDARNVIVARTGDRHGDVVGRSVPRENIRHFAERTAGLYRAMAMDGVERVFGFHKLSAAPGWTVILAEPAALFDAAWREPLYGLLVGGVLALAVGAGLVLLAARALLLPLRRLGAQAAALAATGRATEGVGKDVDAVPPSKIAELEILRRGFAEAEASLRSHAASEACAAAALSAREAELSALFRASPIGIVRSNADGRVYAANDAFLAIIGMTRAELEAGHIRWDELTPRDKHGADETAIAEAMADPEGRCQPYEKEFIRPDGTRVPVLLSFALFDRQTGQAACFVVDLSEVHRGRKALAESEARLRRAQRIGRLGGFEIDLRDGVLSAANYRSAEYMNLQGREARQIVERHGDWVRRLHPEDRERAERRFLDAIADSAPDTEYAQEYRIVTPHGEVRWIAARAEIERDPATGRALRILGAHVDVTELKQAQAALAENEASLRSLLDLNAHVPFTASPDGRVLDIGGRWLEWTGVTREEALGGGWMRVAHPEFLPAMQAAWARSLATGEPYDMENLNRIADGTYRWMRTRIYPRRNANGQILGWYGTTEDIHDRRQADTELRAALEGNARLAAIVTSTSDAIISFDAVDGRIRSWNAGAETLFGYTEAEAVGGPVSLLLPPELATEDPTGVFRRALAGEPVRQYETERQTKNGTRIPVEITATRMLSADGRVMGVSAIFHDLRAHKTAEAALAESEARFRAVVQDQAELVCRFLGDGTILFVNEAYATAFGRSAKDLEGTSLFGLVPAEEYATIRGALDALTPERPTETAEHRVFVADGTERWMEWTNRLIAPASLAGGPALYQATGRDTTERRRIEATLRESETLLRLSQEAGRIGGFMRDLRSGSVTLSEGYRDLFGMPPGASVLDESEWAALVHPDDRARVAEAIRNATESGAAEFAAEYRIIRPADGAVRHIEARARCERDATGRVVRVYGLHLDVTERKATEAAVAGSEARYRSFVEASSAVIWTMTPDGQVGEPIPSWQAYTGQSYEEAHGLGFLNAIHEDDRPAVMDAWRTACIYGYIYEIEYRLLRHDGMWRTVLARGAPVRDASGKIIEWIGTCVDITQHRMAEAALRESEARLRLAQRIGRIGTYDWEMASNRATYSEEYVTLHGLVPGTVTESFASWLDRVYPEDRDHAAAAVSNLTENAPLSIEYRIVRPNDGAVRWIAERREVFRDAEGQVVRVIGSQQDITEQREAETVLARSKAELERLVEARTRDLEATQARLAHIQRMEALGQLAGGIAHDFNNVLQAVQGGASLIERRSTDVEGVRRLARMIFDAASRGASITRRLLAFSRRGDLRAEAVDPVTLLTGMREVLTHTLGAGVGVRVQAPSTMPPLLADKGQLETVLINLSTNARDAMAGNGTLTLSAEVETLSQSDHPAGIEPGWYVCLSVSDTGSGMTPDVLARVTEPFFTTKAQGHGTGLGLAMAKGFAEQSGGGLQIDSTLGQGTRVRLWFPLAKDAPASASLPAESTATDKTRRARLLVVDDEPIVREILSEGLETAGYAVVTAENGPDALSLLDAGEAVDLLVSDLSMPGMDGLTVVQEAQRRRPRLPAILLTGFATNAAEIAVGGAVSGAFTLLRKPIESRVLAERVGVLLEGVGAAERK